MSPTIITFKFAINFREYNLEVFEGDVFNPKMLTNTLDLFRVRWQLRGAVVNMHLLVLVFSIINDFHWSAGVAHLSVLVVLVVLEWLIVYQLRNIVGIGMNFRLGT
jgi:hypothetical protein